MRPVIYETKGRAREYFELAVSLYVGCAHGCKYCFGPDVTKNNRFHIDARPRTQILRHLEKDADRLRRQGEQRPILMSFVTDPYQPAEEKEIITRYAIEILHAHGLHFAILTKAGKLAQRDFDLYEEGDRFGTTLTFYSLADGLDWEPRAGAPGQRMENLYLAKVQGIRTFVSFEPVIRPEQTLKLMREVAPYCDDFLVGRWNYDSRADRIDWRKFCNDVIPILEDTLHEYPGRSYYLKRDLARYIGEPNGRYRTSGRKV